MANSFAKAKYIPHNPQKYVGVAPPIYRSSWELSFCRFCDLNENIIKWASEAIKIPYRDPLTDRNTVYVPDFFIEYVDKLGVTHIELIEIKPASQTLLEKTGKNKYNQQQYIKNQAKWAQARIWCKQNGIVFRIVNENDIFSGTPRK